MAGTGTIHSKITDNIVRVGLNYQFRNNFFAETLHRQRAPYEGGRLSPEHFGVLGEP